MTARLSLALFALGPMALLAACGSGTPDATAKEAPAEMPNVQLATAISPQDYYRLSAGQDADRVELIDVRTPEEFADGHIANATNVDWKSDDFAAKVSTLPKDGNYVLYCRSGHRSGEAQEAMSKMGFHNVASMTGGITAWQNGEMPVVK